MVYASLPATPAIEEERGKDRSKVGVILSHEYT